MLKEVPEAFLSIDQEVKMLQTQPCYQTGESTRTFCKLSTYCWESRKKSLVYLSRGIVLKMLSNGATALTGENQKWSQLFFKRFKTFFKSVQNVAFMLTER